MKKKILNNTFLSIFSSELAMLLDAGISLGDSVQLMKEDELGKEGQVLMQSLLDALERGEPFSGALTSSGHFPRYMVHMVEIGEKTGRLVETFGALSEYYDRQSRLSATIKSSVLYPAILLVLMVVVVLVLIVQVLPIFNDVFGRLGTQMSPLAVRLMQFGGWLGDASVIIASVIGVIMVLAFLAWIVPGVRRFFRMVFMNNWGSRGVFGHLASSRFASAMALAMASGLDIQDAVDIASSVSGGTKAVDKKHKKCAKLLAAGSSLSDALREAGILSPQEGKMLSIGARSGRADTAMAEIARRSDRSVQDEIDRIVGRIEPTLVIISSVVVGVILLSVMLPLMGIMTSIG